MIRDREITAKRDKRGYYETLTGWHLRSHSAPLHLTFSDVERSNSRLHFLSLIFRKGEDLGFTFTITHQQEIM